MNADKVLDYGSDLLYNTPIQKIYVPLNLLEEYKTKKGWSGFAEKIEPVTYTLCFNGNGATGSAMPDIPNIDYGISQLLPTNTFVREGYVFLGWAASADATEPTYKDGDLFNAVQDVDFTGKVMTLYAVWQVKSTATQSGVFTINNANKKVYFALGNLQYRPNTQEWRFAETQYDFMGKANNHMTLSSYTGWLDLFSWSTETSNYGLIVPKTEANHQGDFVDLGKTMGEEWFTLSQSEWDYLLCQRPNADSLLASASVVNANGIILLPDNWKDITGIKVNKGYAIDCTPSEKNMFSALEWNALEEAGAVFLPFGGMYNGSVGDVQSHFYYRTATPNPYNTNETYVCLGTKNGITISGNVPKTYGCNVRLVRAHEELPITVAEAMALPKDETFLLDEVEVVLVANKHLYIKDESGYGLIYNSPLKSDLHAGDRVKGLLGVSSPFHELSQLKTTCTVDMLTITPGEPCDPIEYSRALTTADIHKYMVFRDVQMVNNVTLTPQSSKGGTLVVGGKTLKFTNTIRLEATLQASERYDFYGTIGISYGVLQIYFVDAIELPATATEEVDDNDSKKHTMKLFKDGNIYILQAGKTYDLWGREQH